MGLHRVSRGGAQDNVIQLDRFRVPRAGAAAQSGRWQRLSARLEAHRDLGMEAVRIYLGFAILAKGVVFISRASELLAQLQHSQIPFSSLALAHLIALTHLAGGGLLAVGLLTRFAALAQLPIVAGAVLFVHGPQGLFSPTQGLEFSLLVGFLLFVLVVHGGGRLSADHYLSTQAQLAGAKEGSKAA